jgi:transcriptional regulator with XRE-family HTH domain
LSGRIPFVWIEFKRILDSFNPMTGRGRGVDGKRIKALRILKGFESQQSFARKIGVPQSHISDLESGRLRSTPVFLRVADVLDSTTDFLFGRGPFRKVKGAAELRAVASRMAFDVFVSTLDEEEEQAWKVRCARVVNHPAAPITSRGWRALAEQIDLAVGGEHPSPRLVPMSRKRTG